MVSRADCSTCLNHSLRTPTADASCSEPTSNDWPALLCERWLGAGLSEATASEGAGDRHALQLRFTEVLTKIYLT